MAGNDFFMRMCKEAQEELASGKKGSWREVSTNTLLLAAFGMLANHLATRVVRPLWLFAGMVATGVVGYLVHLALGG